MTKIALSFISFFLLTFLTLKIWQSGAFSDTEMFIGLGLFLIQQIAFLLKEFGH
jgi:hypothetical protein